MREGPAMPAPLVVGGTVSPSRCVRVAPDHGARCPWRGFPASGRAVEVWGPGMHPREAVSGEQYGRYGAVGRDRDRGSERKRWENAS